MQIASSGLKELEKFIVEHPPSGVTAADVAALFHRHRSQLAESLAELLETHQAQRKRHPENSATSAGQPAADPNPFAQHQLAAYANKYRAKQGPFPATPQSVRMVLGGKILKLADHEVGPLLVFLNAPRSELDDR